MLPPDKGVRYALGSLGAADFVALGFRSPEVLRLENLALWHQLAVYQQAIRRLRLRPADRLFWASLSRLWPDWREALMFVQPHTVNAWQRKRFREHWTRLSRHGKPGRPAVTKEVQRLIHRMCLADPTWGVPRISGELRRLGIHVAKSTVETYRVRPRKPASPIWKTFLTNHVQGLMSLDFFVVPTVTHKILFVLLILVHHRRCVVHFKVTEHPTAQWTAQQVVEAFPWNEAPTYLLRDRDHVYGVDFRQRAHNMGIEEVVIAPQHSRTISSRPR